jgi:hypothetical protein
MPLHWTIDSKGELVTVVADGDVTRADADAYLDAMEGAGAIGYRKLFDGMAGTIAMDTEDLLAVGVRVRSFHRGLSERWRWSSRKTGWSRSRASLESSHPLTGRFGFSRTCRLRSDGSRVWCLVQPRRA